MKGKIQIVKKTAIKFLLVISIILVIGPSAAIGYWKTVHQQITSNAIGKSSLTESVKQIGFTDTDVILKGSIGTGKPKSIRDWIEYGAHFEDDVLLYYYPLYSYEGILNGHFYNPVNDLGLTDDSGEPIGQSLIERANDSMNEWSYQMIKDLYYAALTGDSTKRENWIMRDRWWQVASVLPGEENMNQEKRERFFAWTFQALGHSLHLIQDASVPAHTRNDSHIAVVGYDPYERWTRQNAENEVLMNYNGAGSEPWPHWNDHPTIIVPNVFIDTHPLPEQTAQPSEDLNQGLAEYSHANFLSDDSIFSQFAYPDLPRLWEEFPNYDENDIYFKGEIVNGIGRQFIYFKSKNYPQGVEHLAVCGILYNLNFPINATAYQPMYTVDDHNVNQDYAEKLIPRAVGYSAGSLDYFFRGKLHVELLVPSVNEASFSIGNEDDTGRNIDKVAVFLQNNSKVNDVIEPIGAGTIELIVSYTDSNDQMVYKSAVPINVTSIPEFGSGSYIPALFTLEEIETINIKDLTYYLVFRGQLGDEADAVIGKVIKSAVLHKVEPDEGPKDSVVTLTGDNLPIINGPFPTTTDSVRFHHSGSPTVDVVDKTDTTITVKVPSNAALVKPGYGGLRLRKVLSTGEVVYSNPVPFFPIADGVVKNVGTAPINVTVEAIQPILGDYNQLPDSIVINDLQPGLAESIQLVAGYEYVATANTSVTHYVDFIGFNYNFELE